MWRPRVPTGFLAALTCSSILVCTASAAFIHFENCLDPGIIHSDPKQLQFTPYFFSARFNTTEESHNLNITVYGNVSGQATEGTLPSSDDDSYWSNPNETFGKIVDLSVSNNRYTTIFAKTQVATYTPWEAEPARFCQSVINASCPLAPSFDANQSDPNTLPAFTVAHDYYSTYAFTTFGATVRVQSGDRGAPNLACVSANITPDLGSTISNTLRYLPAAILAFVGIATVFAAVFSPWGSSDPFRWTSNYGRDEDLLRLVTPGFGDCLAYIQFVVLAGSLNLNYPGYFQPVISKASWSTLLFSESLVTPGSVGYDSLVDGIYVVNGTYGLSRLAELIGIAKDQDIWAGVAIWYAGITVGAVLLCQIGFLLRWTYRSLSDIQEEDLRSKNIPFSTGIVVRMTFNYFLLPLISISFFQLVVAGRSPASVVAMAVILLAVVMGLAGWIFRLIFTIKPRAHLFDDLPTVLTYGPLYNTYSDDAAPFAFIPVLLTFIRGVAIGAIQPSGIAQIIVLAICEVIYILTLHAFRPFQAPTSMNAYHTFFSAVRLAATLLSVAFVPSLDVSQDSKGWIGYIILFLHAVVLVFGFFLNSIQTIIEVIARLAGAGDARGGLTKVFGKRQLSRRTHRRQQQSSMNSNVAMLPADIESRPRSLSASSAVLLRGFDHASSGGDVSNYAGTTPDPGTPHSSVNAYTLLPSGNVAAGPRRPTVVSHAWDLGDPFYRPPRMQRAAPDAYVPGDRSRQIPDSPGWATKSDDDAADPTDSTHAALFPPSRGTITVTPAYLDHHRDGSDPDIANPRKPHTDYAVRESDFYYGATRGPPLTEGAPTRKLKTGPADPMGLISSAGGWLKGLLGGKRKEKGKGFEVVRSTRAPRFLALEEDDALPRKSPQEPYRDNPDAISTVTAAARRTSDTSTGSVEDGLGAVPRDSEHNHGDRPGSSEPSSPALIETGVGIELPDRAPSKANPEFSKPRGTPGIPRRSSRRTSEDRLRPTTTTQGSLPRIPFGSVDPSPSPDPSVASNLRDEGSPGPPTGGTMTRSGPEIERPLSTGYVHQHKTSEHIQPGLDDSTHLGSAAEFVQAPPGSRGRRHSDD